ncbi:MAG: aminopeptidase, partial [Bacteroidota bacterium]
MITNPLQAYARLLVNYCLELKAGERLYVRTTTLAEDLVREVYREAMKVGAHMEYNLEFRERERIFFNHANQEQLSYVSPLYRQALEEYVAKLLLIGVIEENALPLAKLQVVLHVSAHLHGFPID